MSSPVQNKTVQTNTPEDTTGPDRSDFNLLNEADLARVTGRTISGLRQWRVARKGPEWIKVGRRVFYEEKSVNEWFAAQRKSMTQRKRG